MTTSFSKWWLGVGLVAGCASPAVGEPVAAWLARPILGPTQTVTEVRAFTGRRVPAVPEAANAREWRRIADRLRRETLEGVVFRGEAARWRTARTRIEWFDTIEGGPGYRIRKLRYEALPGFWIPALLYEPEGLSARAPVVLNLNGHEAAGKAVLNKQIRCINLAKRGMLALSPEWPGMGQLNDPNYRHAVMNQLDLCGTSGLAPFYLAMQRGLDVLLALKHADRKRVAVTGLSGGGWQTVFLGALDDRVTLANPVAGYSSLLTRTRFESDLGDSEQHPCDLATVVDYTHLTALRAPRPTLLTYNARDECCFAAAHALPPLLDAAEPVFRLLDRPDHLRVHINHEPGTHNFDRENREALYRMLGDHFYPNDRQFLRLEIPSNEEIKTAEQLRVDLPAKNASFHTLALDLSSKLPRQAGIPTRKSALARWQAFKREQLREIVRAADFPVTARKVADGEATGAKAALWRLQLGEEWTVPVAEFSPSEPKGTTILLSDDGRRNVAAEVERLLTAGQRVLAVDLFYFGESRLGRVDVRYALLVSAVGERPLGIQAAQLDAVARWAGTDRSKETVKVFALGPRSSLIALVAAGLSPDHLHGLELRGAPASLKEIIEHNRTVDQMPEAFCFGLLEAFDVPQLAALVWPRTLVR